MPQPGDQCVARPVDGGPAVFDQPGTGSVVRWRPDGKALALVVDSGLNIAVCPLDGSPAPLTRFKRGFINSFDFAPDGKLLLARGEFNSDLVMISNFRRIEK